jgi:hypothetical protein
MPGNLLSSAAEGGVGNPWERDCLLLGWSFGFARVAERLFGGSVNGSSSSSLSQVIRFRISSGGNHCTGTSRVMPARWRRWKGGES